ncbi:MAG TPA: hypothetical protein VN653_03520 [Anaerolineales bacterium]|nr:hypothetical protein [Anaerolineales bacterium]
MSTHQNKGDHLFVEINEPYSLKLLISNIHAVADHCRKENLNKVLVDIRKMEGNPSIFDRFQLGLEIVKAWGTRITVAVVAKPSLINRTAENTAVNRGAKVKAFSEMKDAMEWLGVEFNNQTTGV